MNPIDRQILALLQQNSRATASEISRKVNLSIPAVSERIRRLEDAGVIEYYTIRVNRPYMSYNLLAFIYVTLEQTHFIDEFRLQVVQFPEVLECHHLAGDYDYILKVLLYDTSELESFLSHKLKSIPGVIRTNTQIAMSTMKEKINREEHL